MPTPPAESSYHTLVRQLRDEIARARTEIVRFLHHQKVVTNWNIGRHLDGYLGTHRSDFTSENKVIQRLAKDLDVNRRYLQLTVRFYRTYPSLPGESPLNWSHYRNLLRIKDPAQRLQWEKKIRQQRLSCKVLEHSIFSGKVDGGEEENPHGGPLPIQRGELYVYRLLRRTMLHRGQTRWMVDCGFAIGVERPVHDFKSAASGTLVRSDKTEKGYRLSIVHATTGILYTYAAIIERVVDGDTVIVHVDCGFGIWIRQRLRLRGIDAPERKTIRGEKAKRFVEETLKGIPFVVIKTHGSDKYDRYLVDIFFLPGEKDPSRVAREGQLLNQRLLDEGLAVRVCPYGSTEKER